ncbi:hypothetical protein JH06_5784 [Blastocystis sp. subtype 4]|uniref:hypothetical protein n=1 Tax=Blastocystis sp. subtype 4 TaxID=944170 RepID=UPI000711A938|nr:hypothetical protein JH06_5784 [Blastocystis sp. subtype 4]KNB41224.1 hypothetical protein JH06_5784 [Blastocystis sp. subtype 4]|eukprot:XP_014524667.1 hypothetical protein JH06_5784 [Blastocystis sp. subtype 4]
MVVTWEQMNGHSGQKRRIYFSNNTPYNQFKFENFGTGDSSSCTWYVQSLDLFADNVMADIPNFTYDSSVTVYRYIEMAEVIPQNNDGYMNFRINPSLPDGIVLDPYTGWISGTATDESSAQIYTITATKISGGDVTVTISFEVTICSGTRGLMTVRFYADYYKSENSWKLYEGRGTSGTQVLITMLISVWIMEYTHLKELIHGEMDGVQDLDIL